MSINNDAALRLDDMCKSYGRIRAVDHLSLEVLAGEMAGFLGPNGAGKSTTLYMTSRLVHPTGGEIEIFGRNVWSDFKSAIQYVGTMVETPSFYEYLSARKNLELMGRLRGDVSDSEISENLERIGLSDRQNDKVSTYSHGMKQRLGLGMTLLGRPRLLVLDEPTNGMDPEGTREILSFLQEKVRDEGLTVFISSHLLYEVEEYCDRVFVINHGRLISSGKVQEILAPHENVVLVSFGGKLPDTGALIKEEGIEHIENLPGGVFEITLANRDSAWLNDFLLKRDYKVSSLTPRRKTLKEFFLSITGGKE
ncbi:MAG: ATP-binding cassette domain-containing protein [Phycisphaerae bacterium]|nr:ABC transporter ATP-binding protein [Phycisphaerae bacterium]NIP50455.1 ABC transporter ATP-binding protein [Phycisphaerae bacterium]NIS49583.1 ABC transporter ATP-binding protein [Phycisphaerae bacterium]NIU07341.1 ABC transporter ATP-binding protein [Phycisphaerae bacterium]NIU54910.1 ATP-binding cassette domain-containing protein [Phycisphaerae bacterium]